LKHHISYTTSLEILCKYNYLAITKQIINNVSMKIKTGWHKNILQTIDTIFTVLVKPMIEWLAGLK